MKKTGFVLVFAGVLVASLLLLGVTLASQCGTSGEKSTSKTSLLLNPLSVFYQCRTSGEKITIKTFLVTGDTGCICPPGFCVQGFYCCPMPNGGCGCSPGPCPAQNLTGSKLE
jgi:hypothetical protein